MSSPHYGTSAGTLTAQQLQHYEQDGYSDDPDGPSKPRQLRLKIKIREQLSILVAFFAVTAVGILSLVFVSLRP